MSQTIILSEDQYAILVKAGEVRNQTPEGVLAEWIEAAREDSRSSSASGNVPNSHPHPVADDPNATQPSMTCR